MRCTGNTVHLYQCVVSIGGACPPTWTQWEDKCYKITEPLSWLEAEAKCKKMGGGFAAPTSDAETEFLRTLAIDFWINCSDRQVEGMHGNTYSSTDR